MNTKLNKDIDIKVEGRVGSWYIIDCAKIKENGKIYYLLESNTYGDDAAGIVIEEPLTVWKMKGVKPNGTETKEYYYISNEFEVCETYDTIGIALIDEDVVDNEEDLDFLD